MANKLRKIHGRPLLPWWAYVGYFLLCLGTALWNSIAHGDDMKPATGKTAEKAKYGRRGDTRIAHVNPFEEAILKAMGGAGTTNPKTGYKEYWSDADPNSPDTGSGMGGAGIGGGVTGGADPADKYSPEFAREVVAERSRERASQGLSPLGDFTGNTNPISTTPASPVPAKEGLLGPINPIEKLNNPKTAGPALAGILGPSPFGALAWGAQALNDKYFDGKATTAGYDFGAGGGNAMEDAIARTLQTQPVAAPTPDYLRPAQQEAPAPLGLGGNLTDLQKRAQIATGGTQASSGQYRTPEAMRFYGNLIARALIGENNKLAQQNPNLLPIEDTYLKQVFGVTPQNNAASLLDALKPYWST